MSPYPLEVLCYSPVQIPSFSQALDPIISHSKVLSGSPSTKQPQIPLPRKSGKPRSSLNPIPNEPRNSDPSHHQAKLLRPQQTSVHSPHADQILSHNL